MHGVVETTVGMTRGTVEEGTEVTEEADMLLPLLDRHQVTEEVMGAVMVADMAEEDMNRDPGTEEVMLHPLLSRDTMEEEDMDKDKGKVTDRDIIKEDVRKFSFEELCL